MSTETLNETTDQDGQDPQLSEMLERIVEALQDALPFHQFTVVPDTAEDHPRSIFVDLKLLDRHVEMEIRAEEDGSLAYCLRKHRNHTRLFKVASGAAMQLRETTIPAFESLHGESHKGKHILPTLRDGSWRVFAGAHANNWFTSGGVVGDLMLEVHCDVISLSNQAGLNRQTEKLASSLRDAMAYAKQAGRAKEIWIAPPAKGRQGEQGMAALRYDNGFDLAWIILRTDRELNATAEICHDRAGEHPFEGAGRTTLGVIGEINLVETAARVEFMVERLIRERRAAGVGVAQLSNAEDEADEADAEGDDPSP